MLNLLKADLYRVCKTKTLWITIVVLIVYLSLLGFFGAMGTVGLVNTDAFAIRNSIDDLSGSIIQILQMATGDNLFYFFLPILVIVIGADFSNNTMKNTLSMGYSRTKYYLSKLVLSGMLCSILILIYETIPLFIGTIRYGFGSAFDTFHYGKILITQIPIYLALVSLGTFIALAVRKTAILNAIYIPMFMLSGSLVFGLINWNEKLKILMNFELGFAVRKYVLLDNITTGNMLFSISWGIIVILISTLLGLYVFKNCEIK